MSDNDGLRPGYQDVLITALGVAFADVRDYLEHEHGLTNSDNMAWWIAWKCLHPQAREAAGLPRFQKDFCKDFLGVSITLPGMWRQTHGDWLDDYIASRAYVGKRILESYEDDIFEALGSVASDPDPRAAADRKTALEILGHIHKGAVKIKSDGTTEVELDWGE